MIILHCILWFLPSLIMCESFMNVLQTDIQLRGYFIFGIFLDTLEAPRSIAYMQTLGYAKDILALLCAKNMNQVLRAKPKG